MKRNLLSALFIGLAVYLFSGCSNPLITDLKSETMKGGPAVICDDPKLMYVTFANPTTASWTLDVNNSVIRRDAAEALKLVWEQNQYQKQNDALGYKVRRVDGKSFEAGLYTFKMVIIKDGVERVHEGGFKLKYGWVIPIVMN